MIIFRCNISYSIGSGHLFRCIELYKLIDFSKKHIIIKCDDIIENYRNILENINCSLLNIDDDEFEILSKCTANRYGSDAEINIIVLDLKDNSIEYINKLKKLDFKIVAFDDLGNGSDSVDILIDANIHISTEKTNRFFGPDYIFLPRIFSELNQKNKVIKNEIENITFFFGGADPENISAFLLDSWNELSFCKKQIKILAFKKKIKNLRIPENVEIIEPKLSSSAIAEIYYNSDLLIIAGGITVYEVMCIGVPAIVINQNEEQNRNVGFYDKFIENIGVFNKNTAIEILNERYEKIADRAYRELLSLNSKKLIDGKGFFRIIDILMKLRG